MNVSLNLESPLTKSVNGLLSKLQFGDVIASFMMIVTAQLGRRW